MFGMNLSSIATNPLYSSLLAAYLVASGLVGAAITYYFNDESNEKLNTLLKVSLTAESPQPNTPGNSLVIESTSTIAASSPPVRI